ncbi:STAS domain-containing protein [Streptomyces sp. NRRL F-2747]|uniref:STAS domain-containing protein n=1 Tax=Streptomyces sp. NRRL F-2747 TaxID=1463843 RepID=UPI0005635B30|nr:STAS domain-containing protein [Streptomyces sp. NRRL F-2747]
MVSATAYEGVAVIHVTGDLDEDTAHLLTEALVTAAANTSGRIVVDLSGTGFADSSVLHALFHGQKLHATAGASFVIAGPLQAAVLRLFEVTGSNRAFRVADSLETAMTC